MKAADTYECVVGAADIIGDGTGAFPLTPFVTRGVEVRTPNAAGDMVGTADIVE